MIELDREYRLSDQVGKAKDGLRTRLGSGPAGYPKVHPDPSQVVGRGQSNTDSPGAAFVFSIREQLEEHPHFRGRTSLICIELFGGTIVLTGCLPTYYLKQLLQEAIRMIPGVAHIDNRVLVMRPDHCLFGLLEEGRARRVLEE